MLFEVEYITFVHACIKLLDRHLRVEELIELPVAVFVVCQRAVSKISLHTVLKIFLASLLEGDALGGLHFKLFHCKNPPILYIKT